MAAFCREHGLGKPQFFAWRKRLAAARTASQSGAAAQFVAVRVTGAGGPARGQAIEVRVTSGRSIMLEPGFDAAHLRAVLDVLEGRA